MTEYMKIKSDILVIGAGGAGFRAAIAAAESGLETVLVNKGKLGRSGATVMADSDLTLDGASLRELGFFGEPKDSKEKFFNDIVNQGFYLNNQVLVEKYVQNAPDRIKELIDWGIKIESSEERAIETPGASILDALYNKAKNTGVKFYENIMITDLLTYGNRVIGAFGLDLYSGEFLIFLSKAIIIATGGWHKAFDPNAGSRDLSGDGIAMAGRAGALLGNMEFITFAANCALWPNHIKGSLFTYILHMITKGPILNSEGEDILKKYDPYIIDKAVSSEWNKCVISQITFKEIMEGRGSEHNGVYLTLPKETFDEMDEIINGYFPNWKYRGGDFSELKSLLFNGRGIEVSPAAEYFEGGIYIDDNCKSTLDGLYAAGESAMSLFGANRVVAATTEMLVTGYIAGISASNYAKTVKIIEPSENQIMNIEKNLLGLLNSEGKYLPKDLLHEIKEKSFQYLGPIRNGEKIKEFLNFATQWKLKLKEIKLNSNRKEYNLDWIEAIEVKNIIELLELSAISALNRTESRGVHYREDFPYTDNINWLKEILISRSEDNVNIIYNPIKITKLKPENKIYPYWEMVSLLMKNHSEVTGGH
ncbi:MAG: FAD-binding protein [Thermoplasmata archaeon]